jgi:hypothetical protein
MSLRSTLYLPKEHGAWGMFFIPLVLGLAVGGHWSSKVTLFIMAAAAAFLAREPFMTAWRSWRRKTDPGSARRAALMYMLAAGSIGGTLLPFYPWLALLGVLGFAVYCWHAEVAMRGEGRSTLAELLAIATSMLTAPAAYYVSSGRLDGTALLLWALCFGYFASAVYYVKMRLTFARPRKPTYPARTRRQCLIYHVALTASLAALIPYVSTVVLAGFLPVLIRAFYYVARPTNQANLKQIGWSEVVYSLIFLACAAVPACANCLRK